MWTSSIFAHKLPLCHVILFLAHRAKADDSSVTASRGLQQKGEHSALWVDCGSQQRDSVFVFHHWCQHQPCQPSLSSLPVHIDTRELDQLFVSLPTETTNRFSLPLLLSVHTVFPRSWSVSLTFVLSESVLVGVLWTQYTDFKWLYGSHRTVAFQFSCLQFAIYFRVMRGGNSVLHSLSPPPPSKSLWGFIQNKMLAFITICFSFTLRLFS